MDFSGRIPADVITANKIHRTCETGGWREVGLAHPLLTRRWAGLPVLHHRDPRDDGLALQDVAFGVTDTPAVTDESSPDDGRDPAGSLEKVGGQPGRHKAGQTVFPLKDSGRQTHNRRPIEGALPPPTEREPCRLEGTSTIANEVCGSRGHPRILAQAAPGPGSRLKFLASIITAVSDTGAGSANPRLVATMSVVVLTVAVLQTGVVPILGVMAHQLQVSLATISWTVTANLLAAASTTPLLGRLADLHTKKRVLLAVLAVVLAGSLLAATTSSFALLIVARVLQGASFALYPIGVSILREELSPERLMGALAVLSAVLGFGGGMGLVVVGLLMRGDADYHRAFWFVTAFVALVTLAAVRFIPERPHTATGSVDWLGAAGLAAGLSLLLLTITEGNSWGWTSARTLASALAAIGALMTWWWWERRCAQPLVSTVMLTRRPILLTNIATVAVGMGLYFGFLGLTGFVQAPAGSGYGFAATVLAASVVFLLPGALAGFLTALVSGRYIDRFGARAVLVVGIAFGILGFTVLAGAHSAAWQVIGAGVLVNVYISLAYGALPSLVVREVDMGETGVATSVNAIARTVGASTAAAIVAVLLGRNGNGHPPESSYTIIFGLGAATGLLALVLIAASQPRLRPIETVEEITDSRAMNHEWG